MGSDVRAAVLSERDWNGIRAPEVHKNTAVFVPCATDDEALYVCGMLNSSMITTYALASSVRGGKGFAGVNLLDTVKIPRFSPKRAAHVRVVKEARDARADPASADPDAIDAAAAAVWGISASALRQIAGTAADLA